MTMTYSIVKFIFEAYYLVPLISRRTGDDRAGHHLICELFLCALFRVFILQSYILSSVSHGTAEAINSDISRHSTRCKSWPTGFYTNTLFSPKPDPLSAFTPSLCYSIEL